MYHNDNKKRYFFSFCNLFMKAVSVISYMKLEVGDSGTMKYLMRKRIRRRNSVKNIEITDVRMSRGR